jgi:hypothetical protein
MDGWLAGQSHTGFTRCLYGAFVPNLPGSAHQGTAVFARSRASPVTERWQSPVCLYAPVSFQVRIMRRWDRIGH